MPRIIKNNSVPNAKIAVSLFHEIIRRHIPSPIITECATYLWTFSPVMTWIKKSRSGRTPKIEARIASLVVSFLLRSKYFPIRYPKAYEKPICTPINIFKFQDDSLMLKLFAEFTKEL